MFALNKLVKNGLAAVALATLFSGAAQATNPGSSSPDTMILGDSIFALSGDIHEYLEADLDENIGTYARSGCQLSGGNVLCSRLYSVERQYARASKTGIKTVIFNGGGNDIQLNSCRPSLTRCMPLLNELEDKIAALVADMRDDGIEEIIFLGYYNATGGAEELREINNYSMNYKAAAYPGMNVKFVDVRAAFAGKEAQYITSDGIHPTAAGSRVLADLLLQALDQ
ncbi:SGNH/GDSL hydrolase family protein [Halopseudomonas sp.]|uniref:SGNH/GDSL hydrolase family protein n=1 Tax=Halopseudomonas sp. TaxID=2901191 RepID=UPI003001291B